MNLVDGGEVGRHAIVLAVAQSRIKGVRHFVVGRDGAVAVGVGAVHGEAEGLLVVLHAIDRRLSIVRIDGTGGIRQGGIGDGTAARGRFLIILAQADVEVEMVLQEGRIQLDGGRGDALEVALDGASVVLVSHRHPVGQMRQGAPDGQGMPMVQRRLGDGLLPVTAGVSEQFRIPAAADVFRAELVRIVHVQFLVGVIEGVVSTIAHTRGDGLSAFGLRAFLGRDDDDAVGASGAVDGGGGGVLQHVYRLDIVGVDGVDTLPDHTVHDDERLVGRVQGRSLTDADGAGRSGRSGPLSDLQAGDLAQEQVFGRGGLDPVQFVRTHGDHRTGGVRFTDLAVADDHYFVQELGVRFQHDHLREQARLVGDGRIADAADFHQGVGAGDGEGEFTLRPGGDTVLGSRLENRGADDRTFRVQDGAFHRVSALGEYGDGHHAGEQDAQQFRRG